MPPDPELPASRLGRFVVPPRLGAGSMGVVFEAYDPEIERKVAIKLLRHPHGRMDGCSPEATRRQREAQATAQLSHPNVVTLYDVGTYGGRVVIAVKHVEEMDLRRWLYRRERPRRETLGMFLQAG